MARIHPKDLLDEPEEESREIQIPQRERAPGTVEIEMSITINLGNYKSAKFNIGVSEPYSGMPGDGRDEKFEELHRWLKRKTRAASPDFVEEALAIVQALRDDGLKIP